MKSRWSLPALAGVLVGLSYFPPLFLPLNLAGFLPILVWLESRPHASGYERLKAGFLFGTVTHLVTLHFLYSILNHSWLAAPLYVCFAMTLGARISLSILLIGWLRRRTGISWALLLPICWLPLEWAQTWGDLRMTGEHLAHSVTGYPFLVQFADLVGPYGVGAFLLATNGLVFEAWRHRGRPTGRRALIALASLMVVVLAYDGWAWTRPESESRTLRVGLVQPDVPLAVKHDRETALEQWAKLESLTVEAAEGGADLIIWPETARPWTLVHHLNEPATYRMPEVQALARRVGAALLVGAEYLRVGEDSERERYNAAFAIDADGRLLPDWRAKVYLVPFVEATIAGGFDAGPKNAVLEVADTKVGILVCYEQLFPDLARRLRIAGAELQVVITNDAWFGRSLFQAYQANVLRLRAIESRTAFVRVANTGISGFVDSRGRYHQQTGLFQTAVEVWDVPLSNRMTLYDRVGDLVAWVAIAALGVAIVLARGSDSKGAGLQRRMAGDQADRFS